MSLAHGSQITRDGLVLQLDAANVGKNAGLSSVQYLIVAGGGGSGSRHGGGGGAGGVLIGTAAITSQTYTVTVGAGGVGAVSGTSSIGSPGADSSAFGQLATGGGAGSSFGGANVLQNGGSGGGSRGNGTVPGGLGIAGQGNAGGAGVLQATENFGLGGGGGGAGSPGVSADQSPRGAGGSGITSNISGTMLFYAGGGGGGGSAPPAEVGVGGPGGGGNGNTGTADNATPGAANTGGGGGGGGHNVGIDYAGKSGGSGIVVIRYPGPQRAVGGTVTRVGNDTVHTYTTVGSSTFEPLTYVNNTAFAAVPDLSGLNNVGTAVNGPVYNSDNGGSFVFDGVDDHVLGSISSSIFTGPHSIGCWFYRRTVKQWSALFSNNVNTTSSSLLTFVSTTNQLGINQAGVSGTAISVDLGSDHLNKWIYAVLTVSGVSNGSSINVYAYKDGSLLSSSGNLYWNMTSSSSFYIGRHVSGAVQIHDGFISNIQIYNRVLTAAEIAQNFEALRGRYGI